MMLFFIVYWCQNLAFLSPWRVVWVDFRDYLLSLSLACCEKCELCSSRDLTDTFPDSPELSGRSLGVLNLASTFISYK